MTMNFKVIDGDSIDYEQVKQDYLNGITGKELQKKHSFGESAYMRLLQRFREDGIPIEMNWNNKKRKKEKRGK